MEEKMKEKFVIHLAGQPASGKSTFAHLIGERFPGVYRIFYDELKWQLSGYERDTHRHLVTAIEIGLYEVVCRLGSPIVFELFFETAEEYQASKKMAEDHGYTFVTIELVASQGVLLKRFQERLHDPEFSEEMSIKDEATFLENLEHRPYLPRERLVIDTASKSIEENMTEVEKYLETFGIHP